MPGNVATAAPATVLPFYLCTAFTRSQGFEAAVENEYPNGESQRGQGGTVSRKRWNLTHRLTATALAALESFFAARSGGTGSFYFYDVYETSPTFHYDETGEATTGRYTVRFDMTTWQVQMEIARGGVGISLVEIV